MMLTAEQVAASTKANFETTKGLVTKTYAGFEKLVELNVAAAKSAVNDAFTHAQNLMDAKDLQGLVAVQAGVVAPSAEKAVSYARNVYGIVMEAAAEFTKVLEGKAAEGQKAVAQVLDNLSKNAPVGTESAVAVIKTAMASSQSAIESAQSAAKQALAMAESNVAAVTDQALSAAGKATKKTAA